MLRNDIFISTIEEAPKFNPVKVKEWAPVAGPFTRTMLVGCGVSYDMAKVMVAMLGPVMVTATRFPLNEKRAAEVRNFSAVSAENVAVATAVPPTRTLCIHEDSNCALKLTPPIVRETPPVVGELVAVMVLMVAASWDKASPRSLRVEICLPFVTAARFRLPIAAERRHITDESDAQSDEAVAVLPIRAPKDTENRDPKETPTMVVEAPPVDGAFTRI